MEFDIANFHFIRPLWLFGLPLAVLVWFALKRSRAGTKWEAIIPKEVVAVLRIGTTRQSNSVYRLWLISWIGLVIAGAGPAWIKQAVPIVKNQNSTILVLDLSPSMLAEDLTPNRLIRAKFKLIDLLRQHADGQVALVAYAGDAHTVSPLTDDPRNLEALLPALHPNIMPLIGSNTEAAIALASKLLKDAGVTSGKILLISDGVSAQAIEQIKQQFNHAHSLSILGVGSLQTSPIPIQGGGFLRSSNNEIVLAKIDRPALREMARDLGGKFAILSADDSDTKFLLSNDFESNGGGNLQNKDTESTSSSSVFDAWTDMGPWLIVLLLPLLLVFFRKGYIYLFALLIVLPLTGIVDDAVAAQNSNTPDDNAALTTDKSDFSWQNLWLTHDQTAAQLYSDGKYAAAANTFKANDWSAIAHYRDGDFVQAAQQFARSDNLANLYNKGNALALSGSLEEAIKAYAAVLEQDAEHSDAAFNKQIVEQLLQQSEQDQSEQDQSEQDQSEQDQSEQDQSEQDQSEQDQSEQGQSEQGQSEQDQSEQDQSVEEQVGDEQESGKPEENDEQETSASEQQKQAGLAETESPPLKDSSEQWLRTIPDDPGGLLKRKFQYQARQRDQQAPKQTEERY